MGTRGLVIAVVAAVVVAAVVAVIVVAAVVAVVVAGVAVVVSTEVVTVVLGELDVEGVAVDVEEGERVELVETGGDSQ